MIDAVLARYIGIPTEEVQRLLKLTPEVLFVDEGYQSLIHGLRRSVLEETLPEVTAAYEAGLPRLKQTLRDQYHYDTDPMTPYTLGTWMVNALRYPQRLEALMKKHERIQLPMMKHGLKDIVEMVGHIPAGGKEWQKALCVVCLPLIADELRNEQA